MTVEEMRAAIVEGLATARFQPDSEVLVVGIEKENLAQKALKLLRLAEQDESAHATFDNVGPVLHVLADDSGRMVLLCLTPS